MYLNAIKTLICHTEIAFSRVYFLRFCTKYHDYENTVYLFVTQKLRLVGSTSFGFAQNTMIMKIPYCGIVSDK